jgi:hypothetical protein
MMATMTATVGKAAISSHAVQTSQRPATVATTASFQF